MVPGLEVPEEIRAVRLRFDDGREVFCPKYEKFPFDLNLTCILAQFLCWETHSFSPNFTAPQSEFGWCAVDAFEPGGRKRRPAGEAWGFCSRACTVGQRDQNQRLFYTDNMAVLTQARCEE